MKQYIINEPDLNTLLKAAGPLLTIRSLKPVERMTPYKAAKIGGSFQHTGTVVAEFTTTAGEKRVVLEFDAPTKGMLHIYRPDQIENHHFGREE
jgi:hypothetical protein